MKKPRSDLLRLHLVSSCALQWIQSLHHTSYCKPVPVNMNAVEMQTSHDWGLDTRTYDKKIFVTETFRHDNIYPTRDL